MQALRIPEKELRDVVPEDHQEHQGVNPYTLPLFGRIYWRRLDRAVEHAVAHAPESDSMTIIDLGCGAGVFLRTLTEAFPQARVLGLDATERRFLKALADLWPADEAPSRLRTDAHCLPLADDSVDLVTALDVLEHLPSARTALDEIHRVLKPKGVAVVSVPTEGIVLRVLRRLYFLREPDDPNADPHWNGDIPDVGSFFDALERRFEILDHRYVPTGVPGRAWNYGRIATCQPIQEGP